ncbi:hypothetical protein [Cytobacillus luteolus]|nr:hypothetical protein [Cytobacillus luteolus]MBP1942658.1 hypothetical protein [Cytobacillus luteolus]
MIRKKIRKITRQEVDTFILTGGDSSTGRDSFLLKSRLAEEDDI